jgi:hypothetical protein
VWGPERWTPKDSVILRESMICSKSRSKYIRDNILAGCLYVIFHPCLPLAVFMAAKCGFNNKRTLARELQSPLPRKRALTLPLPEERTWKPWRRRQTRRQDQCLLLKKLPPELREQIYHYVLGGKTILIGRGTCRLHTKWLPAEDGEGDPTIDEVSGIKFRRIPLLLTCREMCVSNVLHVCECC